MAGIKGKSHKIAVEDIEKLAQIGATQREMACFFGCDSNTLERRLQQPQYRNALKAGDANLNISLRRKQVEMALKGDRTMLIWLGKQRLGQVDKIVHADVNIADAQVMVSLEFVNPNDCSVADRSTISVHAEEVQDSLRGQGRREVLGICDSSSVKGNAA